MMDKIEFKKNLITVCIEHLMKSAVNVENEMVDTQKQANDYGAPKDRYDAFRTKMMRQKDMLGQQLEILLKDIKILQSLNPSENKQKVEFGSIVFTEKQNLFISVSIGKTIFEDKTFFVISPNVPFYQAIRNLKIGDSFTFRNIKDKILEIY